MTESATVSSAATQTFDLAQGGQAKATLRLGSLGEDRSVQAIRHRWVKADIYEYDVTLSLNGHALTTVAVHCPNGDGTAQFTHLRPGVKYDVSVVVKGNVGGTASTTVLNTQTPATGAFDFTGSGDLNDQVSVTIRCQLDSTPFDGTGTVVLNPIDGQFTGPTASESGVVLCDTASGSFPVTHPSCLAFDSHGRVWVTRRSPDGVDVLSSNGHPLASYAVGQIPYGIVIDAADNVWFNNYGSNTLTELNSAGQTVRTVALPSGRPTSIVQDHQGNFFVTYDIEGGFVTKVSPNGQILGNYGVGGGPAWMAIDHAGNLWVPCRYSDSVWKLAPDGHALFAVGGGGQNPAGVAIDPAGNAWVTNEGGGTVSKFNASGGLIATYNAGNYPQDLTTDASGDVWIPNLNGGNVVELSPNGTLLRSVPAQRPFQVRIDPTGHPWFTNSGGNSVVKLAP